MERYDILERLAVGGMGEVFLARQRGQGGFARTVVIKQLLPDAAEEGEQARRLLDEARLAASVAHENVVTVHEVGLDDGRPFLAMEYVHGVALSVLTRRAEKRGGPMLPMVAARIALDVARGLHAAHTATDATGRPLGIVHRDVAPKNILVRSDGIAKVADFGVAAGIDRLCRTATGAVPGTLSYMAPEQAGAAETSPRSDQFALGVVLWEMLTGERLFRGDTPSDTLRRLFDVDIAAPSSVPARHARAIPRALDAVVLRMLARNPQRRYATLAEAARALDDAMPNVSGDAARAQVARVVESLAGDELARRRARIETVDGDDGRTMILASRGEPPTPLTNADMNVTRIDGRVSSDAATRMVTSSPGITSRSSSWSRARIAAAASVAALLALVVGGAAGVAASSQMGGLDREQLTREYLAQERVDGPVLYAASLGEYAEERGIAPKVADPVIAELEKLMAARLALVDAHWQKDATARERDAAALERAMVKHDVDAKAALAVWPVDLARRSLEDTMMFGRAPGEWLPGDMPASELSHMITDARKAGSKRMKKAMLRAARRADVDTVAVDDAMWPLGQLMIARIDASERLYRGDEKQRAEIADIDARAKTFVAERFPAHFFVTAYALWRARGDMGEPGKPVPGYGPIPGDFDDDDEPARVAAEQLALAEAP